MDTYMLHSKKDIKQQDHFEKLFVDIFERQIELHQDETAIHDINRSVTYKEFNSRVNMIAHYLRSKGVGNNTIVGVMMSRSIEMMESIYGIVKAGGAYLPLDKNAPEDRFLKLISDSNISILIADIDVANHIPEHIEIINVNCDEISQQNCLNPIHITNPDDIIYSIYTSGSTGVPKGVLITHRAFMNRICWMNETFPISENDMLYQKTVYTFDVSVWEIFWWALAGSSVCLLESNKEYDPKRLYKDIVDHSITVIHMVPSVLSLFLSYLEMKNNAETLKKIRYVFVSGEKLGSNLVQRFNDVFALNSEVRLVNLYGPTEAAIDVTYHVCDRKKKYSEVPIGRPISNIKIILLNEDEEVTKANEAGELCIEGVGLSIGYLNCVELTFKKFTTYQNRRIFRTGDFAKYNEDHEIVFIGRKDYQVKIRGIRVELEEIESVMMQHPSVANVVVTKKSQNHNQYLCAYVVLKEDNDTQEIKNYLKTKLPESIIPSVIKKVNAIPISSNGKIDRHAVELMGD